MKTKKVVSRIVEGHWNGIVYDRLRLFNRKSPWRQTLDDVSRLTWKDKNNPVYFSKSDAWENSLLLLVFNNTNVALIGDATGLRGSSTAGNLFVSLHTADPGETGDQTTSEMTTVIYGQYTRASTTRDTSSTGWAISGTNPTVAKPVSTITFPAGTTGTGASPATFVGIGTASTSTGFRLYSGAISPSIPVGPGVTPSLTTSSSIAED